MSDLRALLGRIRRRWFVSVAARMLSRVLLGWSAIVLAAALADRALPAGDGATLARGTGVAVAALALAAIGVWSMRRRPDDRRVARFVEERCPDLDDVIVTAIDVSQRTPAPTFGPLVIDTAVQRLGALDPDQVLSRAHLRRRALRLAAAAVCCVLASAVAAPFARRVTDIARARYFPWSIRLAVLPGNVRVPMGHPLRIVARVTAGAGHITPELAIAANGQVRTFPMQRVADGFEVRVDPVDRSFVYDVRAGGARSETYAVTALVPPHVERIDLHYDYPPFTGLAPRDEGNGGDIYAPSGTRVRLHVRTDKPVASGRLTLAEGEAAVPLSRTGDRELETTLALKDDGAYRVSLTDGDGLSSDGTEYFIRLVSDRPPDVHITRPSGDQSIMPLEEVTIEARADDDFGIAAFDLVYSVAGGPEKVVPFTSTTGTPLARVGTRLVAAEDLGVKPGDVIAYYARARDVPHAKPSTLSRSEMYFLEVQPFNEEYALAQSAALAAAAGTQIESLIAAQKEIISATWNLERRSGAGRSDGDIKAVAAAQAELKKRAQQATGVLRERRSAKDEGLLDMQAPQQAGAAGVGPADDAVTAMTRAVERLEARKTSEAISHEMAALHALLRAEAEVRRHDVVEQANGSSGFGNGRQGQDVSSLFDRELKRQQRSNYEQRASVESQPQQSDESALERIKDLARRQEDLSRRLKEVEKLPDEERKRELEKLAREEEDLRKQLEERSSRSSGSSGSNGSNGSGSKGSESSGSGEAARRALEQMQRSMSEMRRNDPGSAAAAGQQAANELRQLESKTQGAPDRKRSLGDEQFETERLASEQRRLADDADRASKDGSEAGADARRRAAARQEQLADRAQALHDGEARALATRMHEAADRLRRGDGRTGATEARQIAGQMEQLAKRLGQRDAGGAKGDTQRLADELDRISGARDRLARLEQQLRGRGQGSDPKLEQEYARELQRTREMLGQLQRGEATSGTGTSTPEEHEWSRSAPGLESWKQDYGEWRTLSDDVTRSLERSEAAIAGRLSRARAADRLRAGGSDRVPDAYRQRVARYFELLAQATRGGGGR